MLPNDEDEDEDEEYEYPKGYAVTFTGVFSVTVEAHSLEEAHAQAPWLYHTVAFDADKMTVSVTPEEDDGRKETAESVYTYKGREETVATTFFHTDETGQTVITSATEVVNVRWPYSAQTANP